ncbi:hypothetical protein [Ralstonia pseudosolanacearum]|uniref:hypothetical protein n=1 Tax=Ralstonia pseudosolanacearum TaxID=1310165 RepID=UPI001FF7A45E|nr:hypothetical protein [Ralstonia pseudosolanacearum]
MAKLWSCLVKWISGEWVVTRWLKTNGGDAILFRTFWVTFWMAVIAVVVRKYFVPSATASTNAAILAELGNWLSAVFGGVYLALYARFSSQWAYLASLYNQIKQTEATAGVDVDVLAQWKAGFIEDAENLHLACKASFAPVIKTWGAQPKVAEAFEKYVPGGRLRWTGLKRRIDHATEKVESKFQR